MNTPNTRNDEIKLLGEKIKDVKIAMMTTAERDGTLRSRPMATQEMEFDGDLWFFTETNTPKVAEVQQHQQVNISYANPDKECYVSVSGTTQLIRERQKIEQLWKPMYKVWFTQGLDDPNLALLQVTVTSAEYWDAPSSKMVQLASFAKAMVTGQRDQMGENQKLNLH